MAPAREQPTQEERLAMARSPLAPGPADEDVTHGQDVSSEDVEDEAYGEEE